MAKKNRTSRQCAVLKLHDELLKSIASKMCVPLHTILQLRCVCKTWMTLFADDSLEGVFQLLCQKPLWCTIPRLRSGYDLAAYDIGMKCWHKWTSTLHMKYFSLYDVCGAAGDWLLVQESSILCQPLQSLWLANPTKKFFRKLPNFPEDSDKVLHATGLGLDGSSEACRVFAVVDGSDFGSYKVYSYDFKLDSWKVFGGWRTNGRELTYSMTLYEGTLTSIRTIPIGDETDPRINVCFFDERKSSWQECSAEIYGQSTFDHLFQWQGHLMLIGGRESVHRLYGYAILGSVHIWQLDRKRHEWVESTRMPDHMVDYLFLSDWDVYESYFDITCATSHDQVCVAGKRTVKEDAIYKCKSRHVMFDLSKGLWWDVPEPTFQSQDVSRFSVLIPNSAFHHEKL